MLTITEIAFTAYPVVDIARARRFYEGLLQLKPTLFYEQGEMTWVEYDIGASTLAIGHIDKNWIPSEQGPGIAFEVEDFEAAVAAVRAAGLSFKREPVETGGCKLAVLLDPEGNSVTLHKRNPR